MKRYQLEHEEGDHQDRKIETIITEWHAEEALAMIRTQTVLSPSLNFQLLLEDTLCLVGNK